jgi:hypothetical protein
VSEAAIALFFLPILWWTGVREWTIVFAFAACAVISALQIYVMSRRSAIPHAAIYLSAVIGLVCRMVGPFVITPALVLTTLMAFAAHPSFGQVRIIAGVNVTPAPRTGVPMGRALPRRVEAEEAADAAEQVLLGGLVALCADLVTLVASRR